jgi:hypothetical protein
MTAGAMMYDMANRLVSVRLDERLLREARRAVGARTESEAIRRSLEVAREIERTRKFLKRWGGRGGPSAFAKLDR